MGKEKLKRKHDSQNTLINCAFGIYLSNKLLVKPRLLNALVIIKKLFIKGILINQINFSMLVPSINLLRLLYEYLRQLILSSK